MFIVTSLGNKIYIVVFLLIIIRGVVRFISTVIARDTVRSMIYWLEKDFSNKEAIFYTVTTINSAFSLAMTKYLLMVLVKSVPVVVTYFFTAMMTSLFSGICCPHWSTIAWTVLIWLAIDIDAVTVKTQYLPINFYQMHWLGSVHIYQGSININGSNFSAEGNSIKHLCFYDRHYFAKQQFNSKMKWVIDGKVQPLLSFFHITNILHWRSETTW